MIGQKQSPSTLLGIAFENGRVHVAQLRRNGDSFEVQKSFSVPLSAVPTNANTAVLGQELRQALHQQNVKEHRCVVSLPVQSVLSLPTKIPELAEADVADFLSVEAERHLPYDPESRFYFFVQVRSSRRRALREYRRGATRACPQSPGTA
jgi:Tfp pilus assembly PilM family ATPase